MSKFSLRYEQTVLYFVIIIFTFGLIVVMFFVYRALFAPEHWHSFIHIIFHIQNVSFKPPTFQTNTVKKQ